MDPGTKVFIFMLGGGAVFASSWWLFRKVFGVPAEDPTVSPPKNNYDPPSEPPSRDL